MKRPHIVLDTNEGIRILNPLEFLKTVRKNVPTAKKPGHKR